VCNLTQPCLYNILEDPEERKNIAAQHPDVVAYLTGELNKTLAWYIHHLCTSTVVITLYYTLALQCIKLDALYCVLYSLPPPFCRYITPHLTPEEIAKSYEKLPSNHWGGYLGPCYKRKGTNNTSTTQQVEV
jgi:hypothetical protein